MSEGAARVVAGRYTLVRALGRGGMGVVWQARDGLLHRDVAIKEIYLPAAHDDPTDPLVRRALREARAAAQLRHPGIITVHDVVTDDGRPWIVMELVGGRSLAEVVREHGVLSEWRTAEIGLRVLEALRAAHRHGILHRDVKPANILIDEDRVVLTDFGIAAVDGATVLTGTGQMVGSPAYLSPERINGQVATAAADLWGLGVTLYATVTGRPPFHGEDTQATLAAVLTGQPRVPAHAGRLWPVIKGMLVKEAGERLTADQAAPLLAVAARPPDNPQPPRRRRRFTPEGVPETLVAPPPTVAAPTSSQPAPPVTSPPAAASATSAPEAAPAVTVPASVSNPAPTEGAAETLAAETDTVAADTVAADTVAADTVAADTVAAVAANLVTKPAATPVDEPPRVRPVAGKRRIAGAAAAVAGIVALTVALVRVTADPPGDQAVAQPTASPSVASSPSASPSPSYPAGVDPCLLGTWRTTSNQAWGLIDDTRVLYSGGAGTVVTYRADGTSITDYSKMRPRTTRYRGQTWSDVHRGTVSSRYNAADGMITSTVIKSNAVDTLRRGGKVNAKTPVHFFPEPTQYRCTDDDLHTFSPQGNFSNQMVRVTG